MKRYKFCTKGSTEGISFTTQNSEEEAIAFFSKQKHLDVDDFLKIYVVLPL